MIAQSLKKISSELEKLVQFNISVERALDLIEASTESLEELVAINTMRECLAELEVNFKKRIMPHPSIYAGAHSGSQVYHS